MNAEGIVEKVARGLFAANLLAAAEAHGVKPPCSHRIREVWGRNHSARQRWHKVAVQILSEIPGFDLGAFVQEDESFILAIGRCCEPGQSRAQRAIHGATLAVLTVGAGIAGVIVGAVLARIF